MRLWLLFALLGCVSLEPPAMYGEITSPNYPQGYPSSARESWEIKVPEGFGIRLYLIHLDIEPSEKCEYDSLQVMVGDIVEQKLCGRRSAGLQGAPLEDRLFPSSSLTLLFQSDFSNQERYTGFSAYYMAVDLDECEEFSDNSCSHFCNNYIGGYFCSCPPEYFLHRDNHTCGVNCSGGLYTEMKAQISSPGYPSVYPENSRCEYRVRLELGYQVIVTFLSGDFDIESASDGSCSYDSLTIKAGGRTFGPFCGSSAPHPRSIETGSNEVDIIFQTDTGGENTGWRLRYSEAAIPCPLQVTPHATQQPQQDRYVFKDMVTVRCEEGYEIVTGQKHRRSFRSSCQGDGTWTNVDLLCQPVDCGPPESIENGNVNSAPTTYGSEIKYRCLPDYYTLTSPDAGDGTYHCSADGHWVNKEGGKELPKCAAVCGVPSTPLLSSSRIFGGSSAQPGNFPWQIMFFAPNRGSGALISDRWVLTAAHVVDGNNFPEMFGGVTNLASRKPRHVLLARKVIIHPQWELGTKTNFDNDIALVWLQSKVRLGACISPICLPKRGAWSSPDINSIGYIAGWGETEKNQKVRILQFGKVLLRKMEDCKSTQGTSENVFTTNMVCAGGNGVDSCQGDSGGPLMFEVPQDQDPKRLYVGGIVSWSPLKCGTNGLYTKVENYVDWIEETIRNEEAGEETGQEGVAQEICA